MTYIIFGLAIIALGVFSLVQAILFRNKVTTASKNEKMVIVNEEEFLKLRLYFSIVESAYLIVFGIINTIWKVQIVYFAIGILPYYFIGYGLKTVIKRKGYVEYN